MTFEILLEARNKIFGKGASGAPFHVYTPGTFRGKIDLRTRAYAVAAGSRVSDSWDMEGFENRVYHLRVCGPNGFLREFAGTVDDPHLVIQCDYATTTGGIDLHLVSHAPTDCTLHIKDHGYKTGNHTMLLKPGKAQSLSFALEQSHHWYDFSVTLAGSEQFVRRFAGRVEIGRSGFSDPVMGQMLS